MVCDDDAIIPQMLAILDREIRRHPDAAAISWKKATYYGGDYWVDGYRNRLVVDGFTGASIRHRATDLICEMFESGTGLQGVKYKLPIIPLAAFSMAHVERLRQGNGGRVFERPCPMTSGALGMLAFADCSIALDLPLTILGESLDSSSARRRNPSMIAAAQGALKAELIPVKSLRPIRNTSAETLLRVQRNLPGRLAPYRLNAERYFELLHEELLEWEADGIDVGEERRMFDEALSACTPDVQKRVRANIVATRGETTLQGIARRLQAVPGRVGQALGRTPRGRGQVIDTVKEGIDDIVQCARYLGGMVTSYQ
jgi:hypothetical protein